MVGTKVEVGSDGGEKTKSGAKVKDECEGAGQDAGSLDAAVQGALQALYPPFEATAPTVLGQVFRLLETSYQGDGLCCLLQFLIPAKRLFEHVRPAACAPYFNCIFLHEGWPLCLHEKVVVHLAPLNPLLLRPGDFYLQAEPCEEHSARITLKHLSGDLRTVEETPVPEATYTLLFTNEWLEEINSDQARAPLHTCLVATESGITPLPWSRIATPEFIDKPKAGADGASTGAQHSPAPQPAAESAAPTAPMPCSTDTPAPYGNIAGTVPGCKVSSWKSSQGKYPGLIKVDQAGRRKKAAALAMPSLCEIISQNLEGEYVDLLELSQEQLDLLARSLQPTRPLGHMGAGAEATLPWANGEQGAGSLDRLGRALLQVSTGGSTWGTTWCSAAELARLILYLCSLPRREAKDDGLTVLVDARKQPPAPVLFSALRSVQSISPGCIHTVLLLAEKELVTQREKLPGLQVETLASLKALGRYVDSSQLPPELDGTFPYCHGEWVQFFQVTSMELAEGLYSQLEEELHSLVSQSNSCLERLEFLQKVRELEAEFGELGGWLDGEAEVQLQEMGTKEWSPNSTQGSEEHFNEFLVQATMCRPFSYIHCREDEAR
ncbi:PREDICTED: uncharacterized protein KIAA1755 homolog [Chaetura pelagica]|uniref:uncharacterized protein KIAA1755 homolog n=1 Tax=Chaetura pelagica TaxID=8897 RepID=UPI000523B2AD|nr:PREDICTED: uncharacterized protein KIAA1755 homolog [Chaetura pelagica]